MGCVMDGVLDCVLGYALGCVMAYSRDWEALN